MTFALVMTFLFVFTVVTVSGFVLCAWWDRRQTRWSNARRRVA